jgi:hypothetical protein
VSGVTDTIYWSAGSDLPVTVAVTVILASGIPLSSVAPTVADAVISLIGGLGRGDALRVLQVLAAVAPINGVLGASVLLDGGTADIVPSSTELIVLSGSVVVS